jgi:sulfur relay (sulfurtransferase) complex TusBCD TusD component (DsrE family)
MQGGPLPPHMQQTPEQQQRMLDEKVRLEACEPCCTCRGWQQQR